MTNNWIIAQQVSSRTARWSVTMTRWLITRLKPRKRWQLISFLGKGGGESTGVVDIIAIRKDHISTITGLKRGDLFDIILIQVKGGSAPWPTTDDVKRLRIVGKKYAAKAIILAEWKKGKQPLLYQLKSGNNSESWELLDNPIAIFGPAQVRKKKTASTKAKVQRLILPASTTPEDIALSINELL